MRTAITLDISSHNFLNPITPVADQEVFTYMMDSTISYEKNKLVARYVQVPLMLSLNTAPDSDRGLKISVGGYAGVLWNGILKQEAPGIDKIKIKDDFNLSKFLKWLVDRCIGEMVCVVAHYLLRKTQNNIKYISFVVSSAVKFVQNFVADNATILSHRQGRFP